MPVLRTYKYLKVKTQEEEMSTEPKSHQFELKFWIVIAVIKWPEGARQESETWSVNEVKVKETRAVIRLIREDQA